MLDVPHEIDALARFLKLASLPRTASAVRALSVVELRRLPYETWWFPVVEEYRREVAPSLNILGEPDIEYHNHLVKTLDSVIPGAVSATQFAEFMLSVRPIVERIGESHGNAQEIYRSFRPTSSSKHVFLNMCFMYVILCEGVFPSQARILLGLEALARSEKGSSSLPALERLGSQGLRTRLEKKQLGVFAAGYNRNIRNAIAHGHMCFVHDSNQVRFRDFRPSDPSTPVFDEVWPLAKFAWLFARLDDAYWVFSTYFQIHFLPSLALGAKGGSG
jgi:hypothetical protein